MSTRRRLQEVASRLTQATPLPGSTVYRLPSMQPGDARGRGQVRGVVLDG
jgi:hypothetical protein